MSNFYFNFYLLKFSSIPNMGLGYFLIDQYLLSEKLQVHLFFFFKLFFKKSKNKKIYQIFYNFC